MSNYIKNSTKLLPLVENHQNNSVFYTEYDSKFEIGDKLYIMVIDESKTDYNLDSLNETSLLSNREYKLLYKEGNKIILDIKYNELESIGLTSLNIGICYIGKIYMKNATIDRGTINGTLFYNVKMQPNSLSSILWKQSIIYTSQYVIKNINFIKKRENGLILKTDFINNKINNYFVQEPDDISLINLSDIEVELLNCNISNGLFNNIEFTGYRNIIDGGIIYNSIIGPNYIINDGYFINTSLYDMTIKWNYGKWNNSYTGSTNNPFTPLVWENGIWEDGIFPNITTWYNGRFINGTFNGQRWYNGIFGYTDINRLNTQVCTALFNGTIWEDGEFNGGKMNSSTWNGGNFYNGEMYNTNWYNGNFYNGKIHSDSSLTYKNWYNGNFYNGTIEYMTWENGTFNNGEFNNSIWNNGNFNNGVINNSTWNNGNFYNGKFQESTWNNGNFYNGSLFNTDWINGVSHFSTMNNVTWSGGTWLNGIANNLTFYNGDWYDGVFNYGNFHKGNWYNGSFNSGYFGENGNLDAKWHNGNFYFGIFNGDWINGIFYTGEDNTSISPSDYIGRPYKQYNIQNVTYTYEEERLPSKKNY